MTHFCFKEPWTAYVNETVLYDMDPSKTDMIRCKVVGISAYPGDAPTFMIMIDGKSLFSYIPIHMLFTKPVITSANDPTLKDLCYANSPDPDITVFSLPTYKNKICTAYLKNTKSHYDAEYLFSIDWFNNNQLFHCVALETGNLALLPSHKIQFGVGKNECGAFPKYLKIHQTWQV